MRTTHVVAFAIAPLVLAGCGAATSRALNETAGRHGQVCPGVLPPAPASTYGFGTRDPARSAPDLATPSAAWVCTYRPTGSGARTTWTRAGDQARVPQTAMPAVVRGTDALVPNPASRHQTCTLELGSRYLLVYRNGTDLTGVVADDFGCDDVRLTDQPFTTIPGDATQPGTVSGVLTAPDGFVRKLEALADMKS